MAPAAPIFAATRAHWLAAVSVVIAIAAPARAQAPHDEPPVQSLPDDPAPESDPAAADRKARELFKQGRDAFEDGRYRDAWDLFRRAYLLSKRPELLYNVGQSADRLRMDREALEAFRLYLQKRPDAENRREVENRVRALEERLNVEGGADPAAGSAEDADPAYLTDEGDDETDIFGEEREGQPDAEPAASGDRPPRTGWQTRLGLGLGGLGSSVSELIADTTITSLTAVGHASLGYDLAKGLVVGGALMFEWGLGASAKQGDLRVDVSTANVTMLGAFVDYYFAPREHGWHALGGLTLAFLSLSDSSGTISSENATGGGLFLGGGYEWPAFDDEWAMGVLGRIVLARIDQDTGKHALAAFSVLATAVWY